MASPRPTLPDNGMSLGKDRRISRACIFCRSRKTKCDLESRGVPGQPPCRRCIELNQECVLATSRRGGRRVRGLRTSQLPVNDQQPADPGSSSRQGNTNRMGDQTPERGEREQPRSDDEANGEIDAWPPPQAPSEWHRQGPHAGEVQAESRQTTDGLERRITSSDLLNPSDALDLLAQVADDEPDGQRGSSSWPAESGVVAPAAEADTRQCYPPLSNSILALSDAAYLLQLYHERYHPFFPIAHAAIFDDTNILEWIEKEEHLLTAILTVASKDDQAWSRTYEACSRHMESLISKLIYSGSTTVGAVEALLILAEWAPQPPQHDHIIGCGKEDHGAWMLVGMAIRLGYLQRLEQTGLRQAQGTLSGHACRQRIAWAACYMSDRQVSIRLGKGFWSRGPSPSTHLRAADFPSLQAQVLGGDNLALFFQAHLELTQQFSNAHDILYSSTSHREQLYLGGEYVRYIDDFAAVLRTWKLSWGSLTFTPLVKTSLILSYDFLRLYINAFAFQANLNRAVRRAFREPTNSQSNGALFSDIAGEPDARFIYESIDAANSLLGMLNGFIDPEAGLRYMPLKYYLYAIYAAVFLFKAMLAGAIKSADAGGVRRTVHGTILRLQKTSTNPHSLGHRYARSLRLLWRKSFGSKQKKATYADNLTLRDPLAQAQDSGTNSAPGGEGVAKPMFWDPLNGFSWKDLDSIGHFITNDASASVTDGVLTTPELVSEQGAAGTTDLAADFWDNVWDENDLIF
ncbi:C6 transcription factor [Fusarium sp. Ph1]|nr:C6 transcription factor [Fusarium sp. Ph1]